MRKILIGLMVLSMLLVFVSCGAEKENQPADETKAEKVEVTTEKSPDKSEVNKNGMVTLDITVNEIDFLERDEEINLSLAEVSYQELILSEKDAETYPNLARVLTGLNAKEKKGAEDAFAELKDWAHTYIDEEGTDYFHGYNSSTNYNLQRADNVVFSARGNWDAYTGGVHSNSGTVSFNYDTVTGEELSLSDVVTDVSAIPELVSEKLLAQNSEDVFYGDINEALSSYAEEDFIWTIDYQGITFCFSPYEIAPYAAGSFTATIFFDENPEMFNEKYTKAPDSYVVNFSSWSTIAFDCDEDDGKTETVFVTYEDYSDDAFNTVNVSVGEKSYNITGRQVTETKNYLVNKNGVFSIYIELELLDGTATVIGLDVNGADIEEIEVLEKTTFADADIVN